MQIAILPARGGSKRIPQKNYRELNGLPTIIRTLEILKEANIFDRIIVSTDHPEVERLAKSVGVEVPFRRPEKLGDDHATTKQVIEHAIEKLGLKDPSLAICCIYPTSVLLKPETLKSSLELFRKNLSSFVVSVKEFEHPINRAMTVDQSTLRPLDLSMLSCRTQDCKIFVHDAGQFYWGSLASWLSDTGILESEPVPFKINSAEGVDVDTMDDWLLLNALIQYREGKNESTK